MGNKYKHLCQWDAKMIDRKMKKLRKIVMEPAFVCRRCGRAAVSKKWLCKPDRLDEA
jgi:hypothetical protein